MTKDVISVRLGRAEQDTLARLIDLLARPGMQVDRSDAMRVALTLACDVLDGRRLTHDQWAETERLNSPDRHQDEIQAVERNPWMDYHLDLIVTNLDAAAAEQLLDTIIAFVEQRGGTVAGGLAPADAAPDAEADDEQAA